MKRKRNPKTANLSSLDVVDSTQAYNGKRLKKTVYGIVSRDTPFIYTNVVDRKTKVRKPRYKNDLTSLPNTCKNKVIAFFDDPANKRRDKCYLIDK